MSRHEVLDAFGGRLELLKLACVEDARTIREVMLSRDQTSLPTAHPSYLSAAFETLERDFSPWGFQYPKYDRPHEFGVKVRLMDPGDHYRQIPVASWLVRKSSLEVGIFYTIKYYDEDMEHEKLRYGVDPDTGALLTSASFYVNELYKPRVDCEDVEYMRLLMQDASEDAGIALPANDIPY